VTIIEDSSIVTFSKEKSIFELLRNYRESTPRVPFPKLNRRHPSEIVLTAYLVVIGNPFIYERKNLGLGDSPLLELRLPEPVIEAFCLENPIERLNESYEISYDSFHAKS
jgi:hypothetical protein